jgi:hypothetical protein
MAQFPFKSIRLKRVYINLKEEEFKIRRSQTRLRTDTKRFLIIGKREKKQKVMKNN